MSEEISTKKIIYTNFIVLLPFAEETNRFYNLWKSLELMGNRQI